MAVSNRAAKLTKLHRICKKYYQPVRPPADRSVLEHLLYACCLEDSEFDTADEAFARLQQSYFDWNEIRVTTAIELSEVMSCLKNPLAAASRLKKSLHSMFETHYQFEIDHLRKENLGKAQQQLEKYKGITGFVVAYVAQNGLAGHAIAVDKSMLRLMYTIGVIEEKEFAGGSVPGLERAIPKNKGVEFFSLTHQLAVAFHSSPFNSDIRAVLLEIEPGSADRLPKRIRKKKKAPPKKTAAKKAATKPKSAVKAKAPERKKTAPKKTVAKKPARKSKKTTARTAARKKKSPTKRLARKKPR